MDILFYILFGIWSVVCFFYGVYHERKVYAKKVYRNVRLLDVRNVDKSTLDYLVGTYQAEGFYYCKDLSTDNILAFVGKESL